MIATRNAGKVSEMKALLAGAGLEFGSLADFPEVGEIEETGSTFSENAKLKAAGYAARTRSFAIADDSGLEVEALGWAPGVLSARYGGPDATDADRIDRLLGELDETSEQNRAARFVCSIAIADPESNIIAIEEGICPGRIAAAPSGTGGFGYDPVFVPDGYDLTFAELSEEIKNQISHRAEAAAKIMRYLLGFTAV